MIEKTKQKTFIWMKIIRGFGEKEEKRNRKKKEDLGKIQLLAVTKHKTLYVKHNLTLFKL